MRIGPVAGIVSWGAPLSSDLRLMKILDFLGVPHTSLDVSHTNLYASEAQLKELRPIASARTIRQALAAGAPVKDMLREVFTHAPSALVYGITPERLSAEEMRSLGHGLGVPTWARLGSEGSYRVNAGYRDVCGSFSGLVWKPVSLKERVPAFDRAAEGLETLVTVDEWPVFARHRTASGAIFLVCDEEVADLDDAVRENFDAQSRFLELFPHMMFVKQAFPDACWRPGHMHGALIIDDPPLRVRYGFLNFRSLVRAMDNAGFSTDIALIPWNFRRTQQSVAALINERRGRFGVSIHGCDHTGSEFGATDRQHLAKLTKISVERMETHSRDHGIDYEHIMVFPQGVFSEPAMDVLQRFNFLAAVNTEVVPFHNSSRAGTVSLADVLAPAITRHGGLSLFPRRNCNDRRIDFAADIFVGKPCLVGAHHTDFADGGQKIADLVGSIRAMAPELKWCNLGTVLRTTYLWRREPDGTESIRMFANELSLTGEATTERRLRVLKPERDRSRVENVFVNGRRAKFDWNADVLTIPITLDPGQSLTVRVIHHNPFVDADTRLGVRHRFKASVRRYLCDIRDNYVHVGRHRLGQLGTR